MERCDVLIVGGGPAGASCAWRLRAAGRDVLVMDKKTFPRDKVCAGWITPAVVDTLELDTADYRRAHVLQPITAFRTGAEGGPQTQVYYDRPVSYGIRRCEFDHYLLKRSGARLRLGESLRTMRREAGRWIINEAIEAPLVIGAGGHFCPVARHLGARPGRGELAVAAQEIEFEMDSSQADQCRVAPDMPELYFCRDLRGYGWCFRKGNFLNVGLGREGGQQLSRHVSAFRDSLVRRGRISPDTPEGFNGHAYLLYTSARRAVVADGVMLVGDAAGLAYPQSGEGIRPAVESGLLAAETAITHDGDYSRQQLEPYQRELIHRFGERRREPATEQTVGRTKQAVARWLLGSRWFSQHVVLERWFLHTHQAPLSLSPI